MRLWSQFVAVALFFPALALIMVLCGLGVGINSVPEFARAAFQEAPSARSATSIVEVGADFLPRSMPVPDRKPIPQAKTEPSRSSPPPPAPALVAAVETPKEPPEKLSTPKKVLERSNPESLDGPGEPLQTAAQNFRGEFASTAGGGLHRSGVLVGNPDAKGEFGDLSNETAKPIEVAKPASPPRAPALPKATEVVVPPDPGAQDPLPLAAAEAPEPPKPLIAAVEVPRAPEGRPHVAPRFTPEAPLEPNEAVPARVEETPRPSPLVPAPPAVETPKVAIPDPAALFKRAQGYLKLNDFNTARLLLTRASEEGHADATFALAEMYDPAKKRLPGITPDGSLAQGLYEKAAKLRR